jgi:phosphatidylinositol alpha-mannosyltransferase
VSQPALNHISRHLPSDYNIIPNGIATDRFTCEGPIREEFADGKLNILFVGRLEKRKGLEHLLVASSIIKKQYPDFRIIVVGPGTRLRRGYDELIRELNLDNIVFTDFVSDTELPQYYRTADIFCAPATGCESFGIVLLEAMACSTPVVASNIDGYASVLKHNEEGLLVPARDEEALAQALLTLINNPALRKEMGTRGKIKAERFSWANVSCQVMDLYMSLLH